MTLRGPVWNRKCQEMRQEQTCCNSCACVCTLISSVGLENRRSILAGHGWVRSAFRNSHGGGSGLEGLSLTGEVKGGCRNGLGDLMDSTGLLVVEWEKTKVQQTWENQNLSSNKNKTKQKKAQVFG